MDWNSFLYKSDSNRPTPEKTYYHHWLPKNLKKLLPFPLPDGEKIPDYYQEFNTLIHVTTFENAVQILRDGFKPLCDRTGIFHPGFFHSWFFPLLKIPLCSNLGFSTLGFSTMVFSTLGLNLPVSIIHIHKLRPAIAQT